MDVSKTVWLSPKEAAIHIGISYATIRKWIMQGKIPCCRQGRLVRFSEAALDKWLQSGK